MLRAGVRQVLDGAELATLADLLAARLADHRAAWQLFVHLGQNFAGSLGELLDVCDDVLPPQTRLA